MINRIFFIAKRIFFVVATLLIFLIIAFLFFPLSAVWILTGKYYLSDLIDKAANWNNNFIERYLTNHPGGVP